MTFPTDAATITRRKSFGICGPAIVVSSYSLVFIFKASSLRGREFAKAAEAELRSELTLVLLGPGVFPCIVLDHMLVLDLQVDVLQRIFGKIAHSFERPKNVFLEGIINH